MTHNKISLLIIIFSTVFINVLFVIFPDFGNFATKTLDDNFVLAIGIAASGLGYCIYIIHFRQRSAKDGGQSRDDSQKK